MRVQKIGNNDSLADVRARFCETIVEKGTKREKSGKESERSIGDQMESLPRSESRFRVFLPSKKSWKKLNGASLEQRDDP